MNGSFKTKMKKPSSFVVQGFRRSQQFPRDCGRLIGRAAAFATLFAAASAAGAQAPTITRVTLSPLPIGTVGYVATFEGTNLLGMARLELTGGGVITSTPATPQSNTKVVVEVTGRSFDGTDPRATRFRLIGQGGAAEIATPTPTITRVSLSPLPGAATGYVATFEGTNLLGMGRLFALSGGSVITSTPATPQSNTKVVVEVTGHFFAGIDVKATEFRLSGHGGAAEIAIPTPTITRVSLSPLPSAATGYVATFEGTNLMGMVRLDLTGGSPRPSTPVTPQSNTKVVVLVTGSSFMVMDVKATEFRLSGHGGAAEIAIPTPTITRVSLSPLPSAATGYVATFEGTNLMGMAQLELTDGSVTTFTPATPQSNTKVGVIVTLSTFSYSVVPLGTRAPSDSSLTYLKAAKFRLIGHGGAAEIAIPTPKITRVTLSRPLRATEGSVVTFEGTNLLGMNILEVIGLGSTPMIAHVAPRSSSSLVVPLRYSTGTPTKFRLTGHGGEAEIDAPIKVTAVTEFAPTVVAMPVTVVPVQPAPVVETEQRPAASRSGSFIIRQSGVADLISSELTNGKAYFCEDGDSGWFVYLSSNAAQMAIGHNGARPEIGTYPVGEDRNTQFFVALLGTDLERVPMPGNGATKGTLTIKRSAPGRVSGSFTYSTAEEGETDKHTVSGSFDAVRDCGGGESYNRERQ